MTFDALWLLALPLFFGLGWLASRLDARSARSATGGLPDAYFRGLNFLLNEQPDKAIDAFVDVVRVDPETIELHFALGNLFRRRGETDRAIRVHQNLADRSDIRADEREHALFELGQDFLKAGLLDRAEDVFNQLEGSRYRAAALHHRLQIAQMVRDWRQAIELAERLHQDLGENRAREIAQFECELAASRLDVSAAGTVPGPDLLDAVRDAIGRAADADPSHPRPWLMRGQLAILEDEPMRAVEAWRRMLAISPAHVALIATDWIDAHRRIGRLEDGIADLERLLAEHASVDVLFAIFDARVARDGRALAIRWLERALRDAPSLLGLEKLLAARVEHVDEGERADLDLTLSLIQGQVRRLSRYVCSHCGFKARTYYWQCPGCSRWDAYVPRRGEELERG
ncbi:MAG: lipopolysaccharide assembly protein LapB [Burkholderiaceae bacterium]|nr:lipopolysaccharide assembly protein LapB [Burkholderiaceae bacterium]